VGSPVTPEPLGYVEKANQYARDVVSGSIPACNYVKLACQRHLDDLENKSVLWSYEFDIRSAERPCVFLELLPHVRGSNRGTLTLEPWQCFIVCNLFGWVKKAGSRSRGQLLRRFRKAYIEVPKGNGKSFLMSGIALYMLALDSELGAEIYSAATTKEQARVVFDVAQMMARNCPKFLAKYGVEVAAHDIHLANDPLSVFKPLASESLFGIIYTIDDTDDWTKEENWVKANPNWGVSVEIETFVNDGRRAIFTTHKQPSFQMKHLNMWVNADQALISARDWAACQEASLDIEDFRSEKQAMAFDLAERLDLCARMQLFSRRHDDGKKHYYLFGKYWLPADTIEKSGNPKYEGWVRGGFLTRFPGPSNDFDVIEQEIRDAATQFETKGIAYDPWNAKQLSDHLIRDGFTMVKCRPTVENFSPPLKELLSLVAEQRIHHDGDPVMAWAISNLVGHTDAKGNIFPRKERDENKIDPVTALIMALFLVINEKDEPKRSPKIWA
jgi:phage terminase large subunit-like protein